MGARQPGMTQRAQRPAGAPGDLRCADLPWPPAAGRGASATVSGVVAADDAAARKKKLRAALLRHHPDKFARVIGAVREDERAAVMARIQAVTQRILGEKERFGEG